MPACLCRSAWPWLGVCAAVVAGCNPPEAVRTYTAPRETLAEASADKSRLLGLIIPTGPDVSRFVKFSGAIDRVTAIEAKFDEFAASVRVPNPVAIPTYSVPAGWVENPPRQFVAKSFTVGPEGTPQVTLSETISGSLLENVNRWRKEVGLPDVTEAELPQSVTGITLGDTKAYRIDLRGPAAPGSAAPRMRGMPATK